MRIILHPLNRNNWAGVVRYKNCHDQIGSYYLTNGLIYTGLSREDEERLSKRLRLDLAPNSDFWDTFYIKVSSKDTVLDTEDPIQELKYLFLKGHKYVASSFNDNTKPNARYVLINRDEEAKTENLKFKVKKQAIKELDKLSKEDIVKVLRLYGMSASSISAEQAEEKINRLVDNDPEKFLNIWVKNDRRETQWLVEEAVSKNIIRKNKTIYSYGTDILGSSLESAIMYMEDPKNVDLKIAIRDQVNAK